VSLWQLLESLTPNVIQKLRGIMSKACPNCGNVRINFGELTETPIFKPGSLRSFSLSIHGGVPVGTSRFWACLDCGHLWSTIPPEKLQKFILDSCSEETRQRWELNSSSGIPGTAPSAKTPQRSPVSDRVREIAIDPTRKIEAIKIHRDETGVSLEEAKAAVESVLNSR